MKKLFLGSLLLMLVAFGSRAQESVRLSAKELLDATEGQQEQVIKEHLKQGNAFYRKEIFERAYRHYLRLYELVPSSAALNYRLGVSALLGGASAEAASYLQASSPSVAGDYYLLLGKALQASHNYMAAEEAYKTHYESLGFLGRNNFEKEYRRLLEDCRFGAVAVQDSLPYFIENMGSGINSYFDEYAAYEIHAGHVFYYTSRKPERLPQKPIHRLSAHERLFVANYDQGEIGEGFAVNHPTSRKHIGVAGVDPARLNVFVYRGKNRNGRLIDYQMGYRRLHLASYLRGTVNSKRYRETSLTVSVDGHAWFVSDRKGEGGMDIWYAQRKGDYKYRKAENIGPAINTPGDEIGAYVTPDGRTLYFASDGHEGFGGFDIYRCERQPDGTWGEPINMGYPINTAANEMHYIPTADPDVAFMASDRDGGYGGLDLYVVRKDNRIPFEVWGEVRDAGDGSLLPARVTMVDLEAARPLLTVNSDSMSGEYYIPMEDVGAYALQVHVDGYVSVTDTLEMPSERHSKIRRDYRLDPLLHPYTLWGNVRDKVSGEALQARLAFWSAADEMELVSGYTDATTGYYALTLADKADGELRVTAEDYYSVALPLQELSMRRDSGELNVELESSLQQYVHRGRVSEEGSDKPVAASLAVYAAGSQEPVLVVEADSLSGNFSMALEHTGPFLIELNAEGYFFLNRPLSFDTDSTLLVRNYSLQPMQKGARIVVENILFNTGKATLRAESYAELNKLARLLNENPEVRIEVSGHTDNVGSAAVNNRLSGQRAESVKGYLEMQGVAADRIESAGYGFERPIAPNNSEEGRAANRRVEIEVID